MLTTRRDWVSQLTGLQYPEFEKRPQGMSSFWNSLMAYDVSLQLAANVSNAIHSFPISKGTHIYLSRFYYRLLGRFGELTGHDIAWKYMQAVKSFMTLPGAEMSAAIYLATDKMNDYLESTGAPSLTKDKPASNIDFATQDLSRVNVIERAAHSPRTNHFPCLGTPLGNLLAEYGQFPISANLDTTPFGPETADRLKDLSALCLKNEPLNVNQFFILREKLTGRFGLWIGANVTFEVIDKAIFWTNSREFYWMPANDIAAMLIKPINDYLSTSLIPSADIIAWDPPPSVTDILDHQRPIPGGRIGAPRVVGAAAG